jgi:protein tyrosine phosphatase
MLNELLFVIFTKGYIMSNFLSHLVLAIAISSSCYAQESFLTHPGFTQEWNRFLESKEIDYAQIGSEHYQDYEFSLLEEFSDQQAVRCRPYIETVDRHIDCRPYSDNKIDLFDGTEMSASLVPLPGTHHFVAAQAPLEHNIPMFWQMISESQMDQIVMLTELTEIKHPEKVLANSYLPQKVGEKIILENDIEITLLEETLLLSELEENIQIRKINLHHQGKDRVITHYWYRNWLDHSVPTQLETISTLINTVEGHKNSLGSNSPILVHCSGGVGRTGVFITLYHLMQRVKYNKEKISLFDFVAYLRWHRPYLIAQLGQYKFCYKIHAGLQNR